MASVTIHCKQCGKKLLSYEPQTHFRKYQSPVKTCPGCGARYADPRCHEIAIEGLPADTYRIGSYLVLIVFGAFMLYRGIVMMNRYQLGVPSAMQWMLPTVFVLAGIVCVVGGIIEIILIKTGKKQERFDRLTRESVQRLSDKSYAYTLQDLGYPVPEEYL